MNDCRRAARTFIEDAAAAGNRIAVSAISLAGIVYVLEKHRLPVGAYEELKAVLDDPDHVLEEAQCTAGIVDSMSSLPRAEVPDMPDHIIASRSISMSL